MFKKSLLIISSLGFMSVFAQVKVSGMVYNEYLETFSNAKIASSKQMSSSDVDGQFTIEVDEKKLPQDLTITAYGYQKEIVTITSFDKKVNVILKESLSIDQVVVSASRIPERIIESPVTIERFSLTDEHHTPSNNTYDGLANIKEVDVREGSYTYNSINTRGFADYANSRFIQLIDGMDTSLPALNYSLSNITGVQDIDIESIEILPGASSALYGANAYNGLMLVRTKNPFEYRGISAQFKSGFTSQKAAGNNAFYDTSVRFGYKFNDAFAAKVNFGYINAEEWEANDQRNKQVDSNEIIDGTFDSTFSYNGINTYGDDSWMFFANDRDTDKISAVYRKGYLEKYLLDHSKSKNIKFSSSLHFRPFNKKSLEVILGTRLVKFDNIVQTALTRQAYRNYYFSQSNLELKGNNFYVRTYFTRNDAGDSYDFSRVGENIYPKQDGDGYSWEDDVKYYYEDEFLSMEEARDLANKESNSTRIPESKLSLLKRMISKSNQKLISEKGSKVYDHSSYWNADGNYNLSEYFNNWMNFQLGGSFREYRPETKGTILNDYESEIKTKEYGVYAQVQKKFFDDKLKFTSSVRYDKSQNFEGHVSPKVSFTYALGENKNHILRLAYQTAFRNPSLQEQYFDEKHGAKTTIGSVKENLDKFSIKKENYIASTNDSGYNYFEVEDNKGHGVYIDFENEVYEELIDKITGDEVLKNSFYTKSYYTDNLEDRKRIRNEYDSYLKPEVLQTIELGYRSLLALNNSTNLDINLNGYYSKHKNLMFFQDVSTTKYGKLYPNGLEKVSETEQLKIINSEYEKYDTKYGVLGTDSSKNFRSYLGNMFENDIQVFDSFSSLLKSNSTNEFNLLTNAKGVVESYGFGIGLHTKILQNFDIGASYDFSDFKYDKDADSGFEPNFNTPKHSVKVQVGNTKIFNNFGFQIDYRWQDKYRWVSTFVKGTVNARSVVDAQINYTVPSMKSTFKLGGTNLFGKEYQVAPGMGAIGQLYYLSWIINN